MLTTSRTRPASSCSGLSTGIAAIVVQFGLAMMPLRASASASGLTSLTTSGTSGSIRQAEELSMTIGAGGGELRARAPATCAPPAENSAMSMPDGSAVAASSTVDLACRRHGSVVPADRAEAKKRIALEREVALGEQAAHDGTDLTGGADDGDDGLALIVNSSCLLLARLRGE